MASPRKLISKRYLLETAEKTIMGTSPYGTSKKCQIGVQDTSKRLSFREENISSFEEEKSRHIETYAE